MKRNWMAVVAVGLAAFIGGAAHASDSHGHGNGNGNGNGHGKGDATKQCVQDARIERNTCIRVCQDEFRAATDTCRGRDHDCAEAARDARKQCVSDVFTALAQCVEDTCSVFDDAIAQCRVDFPKGTPERDACIDAAQVQKFQCRDTCRENVQLFQSLKTCRDEFKADIAACAAPPPAPEPQ